MLLALSLPTGPASAEGASAVTGSLVLGSEYPYRGISRSAGRPSAALDVESASDGPYAGLAAAAVAWTRGTSGREGAEVDVYGGWRGYARGWDVDVGLQYDGFARQPGGGDEDYLEAYARIGRAVGPLSVSAGAHVSPAFADRAGTSTYLEARASLAFAPGWRVSLEAGREMVSRPSALRTNYDALEVRVTRQVTPNVALELVGWANDQSGFQTAYRPRIALRTRIRF